ncbi:unnamed protein product (macronuclear) [Paramecium tetraurelia]|uniref:Chromosome undetermined scaffold_101, whole genome shotgun sequence n=1 Tax=Paramecium tetraurelia TaxID=5888 RepID=A0BDX9_PARTE|nr:uncharacterized protein GSPATT00027777001 [Paramecium tetraurelia]XP_001441636.1 uncharacterized protein GSPATT00038972001 [Paramecium tetraurelia]CAK56746.1 unnamed protein product [Paramecium tetraurelia]CAK74239.1 unnamed protein product [Paramecium tetraurelia]|eukprot:XP_001424144.1 hypothetical protein (macronuclear) [Paramecium tetraurelia strain d4-2]
MRIILSFLTLFFVYAQNQYCNVHNKGVNSGLANQLAHSLNQIRNQVATGQISFEGSSSASNMNVMHWSNGYAKMAQTCVEKCPLKASTCGQFQNYGVLFFKRHLNQQLRTNQVMEKWFKESENAKQLLTARSSAFGCGKAEDKDSEYIVCYFDEKYTGAKQAFLAGPVGASCKLGRSKMYSGLCATASSQTLIHQSSHIKNKKQKKQKKQKAHKKNKKNVEREVALIAMTDFNEFV